MQNWQDSACQFSSIGRDNVMANTLVYGMNQH